MSLAAIAMPECSLLYNLGPVAMLTIKEAGSQIGAKSGTSLGGPSWPVAIHADRTFCSS
jgi:hypothetical protein